MTYTKLSLLRICNSRRLETRPVHIYRRLAWKGLPDTLVSKTKEVQTSASRMLPADTGDEGSEIRRNIVLFVSVCKKEHWEDAQQASKRGDPWGGEFGDTGGRRRTGVGVRCCDIHKPFYIAFTSAVCINSNYSKKQNSV